MDSNVPAMGFMDAKKEIAARFDNEEASIQEVLHIIDKRWDNKLKGPLHRAGYFLNPYYYYETSWRLSWMEHLKMALLLAWRRWLEMVRRKI